MTEEREEFPLDVLFVGAGPANLAGAIHLKRLADEKGLEIEIGLIEKGDQIGSHSLSGAILDPIALKELIPDYLERGCPVEETQCRDRFYYLTQNRKFEVPFTPKYMHNEECCVISLSRFTRWLGEIAEEMGINIFPGFAGTQVLFSEDNQSILGVATGDKGIDKNGNKKATFEPGVNLTARVTIFGEGSRGSLIRQVDEKMEIFSKAMPQVFETAVKEVIELPETSPFLTGDTTVLHTFGYPLGLDTKGGGFLYRMKDNRISLGLVVGLDYEDPLLEPYRMFLKYKRHPLIADIIQGGKVLQQGAKTLSIGGYYTMPVLSVGGALFVGDSAAMLNSQRLKGIHTAMKSGMLAAETVIEALEKDDFNQATLRAYDQKVMDSWIASERYEARNFSQALSRKGVVKFMHIGAQYFTKGRGLKDPLDIVEDCATLKKLPKDFDASALETEKPEYDGTLYLDKLTGVYLSGTQHLEDQPCHLIVHNTDICETLCYEEYRNPCTRFCPAQVYEMVEETPGERRLVLNPSNCLHCKTCEIKDPYKNITWTCPEGGGGPKYSIV
ncbi:MAG: electron transfer flavoprotein-ubiquinone oxidoreductase [Deltaproteobacteria bacterium]|nr:electron transfer flavoprotein-ubiquinone oxidoreductase [Deltaproteobacteria bacterium]